MNLKSFLKFNFYMNEKKKINNYDIILFHEDALKDKKKKIY
jgi:hypothetical protein